MEPDKNIKNEKPKRPKYTVDKGKAIEPDPAAYVKNLATYNARQVKIGNVSYTFEIWVDKHFKDRQQHGDDNGKRVGIDDEYVLLLVEESIRHIVFYSLSIKAYSVLGNGNRVLLKKNLDNGSQSLNVVLEIHIKDKINNIYEVTIVTAMSKNEFEPRESQYFIEFHLDNSTELVFYSNKKFNILGKN